MRQVIDIQTKLGEVNIAEVKFDMKSRDEIPKLLMGLQYIYCTKEIKEEIFSILEDIIPKEINKKNGRKGMDLWKILVLGTIRLNCNWDYDKLHDIVNNHSTIREMLGHNDSFAREKEYYNLQTLKDNICLLTPEVLDRINQVVVKAGHNLLKKKDEKLKVKCDSFVVETNVHYPTDINLLWDAIRKIVTLTSRLCKVHGMTEWRQSSYNLKIIKKAFRKIQNLKNSTSKNEKKKEERKIIIKEAHEEYIKITQSFIDKAVLTINNIYPKNVLEISNIESIKVFIKHAERQIDQIKRRVIKDETIPHDEKIFSIFQEHTEWISKGKAGVTQELGLKVCIINDNHNFILHHKVMQDETDDKVAVPIIKSSIKKFPDIAVASFDKGFFSSNNIKELNEILDLVVLPKKGKRNQTEYDLEHTEEFIKNKKAHSAVESAINALENHGLDRCPDSGINGFKRYISLSIISRNIQILGQYLIEKKIRKIRFKEKLNKSLGRSKLAA